MMIQDYIELCKPRVVALMLVTAIVGMYLASPHGVTLTVLLMGSLGIGLGAGSAATINHLVDRHVDLKMMRTKNRPIATGRVDPVHAIIFASILAIISMSILTVFVNKLTAILTFVTLIGYAGIYTLYLKRATPQNIVIGGAAGATPPLLGWVAVTGHMDPFAWLLVLIIFVWTPPHFWALAIHRFDDYKDADIPMLPVTHGIPFTKICIVLYTLLLSIVSIFPFILGMSGLFYFYSMFVLNGLFLYFAVRLWLYPNNVTAIRTFQYSIVYLFLLFIALLGDRFLTHV